MFVTCVPDADPLIGFRKPGFIWTLRGTLNRTKKAASSPDLRLDVLRPKGQYFRDRGRRGPLGCRRRASGPSVAARI